VGGRLSLEENNYYILTSDPVSHSCLVAPFSDIASEWGRLSYHPMPPCGGTSEMFALREVMVWLPRQEWRLKGNHFKFYVVGRTIIRLLTS
jgi:hypothetical protein